MNHVKSFNAATRLNANKHRKEKHFLYSFTIVAYDMSAAAKANRFYELGSLRIYGTKSTNYCCLWLYDDRRAKTYASGSARTTGYGFHRPSDAAEQAINQAGIQMEKHISERGDEAIVEALEGIALHLGWNREEFTIVKAHA